MLSCPCYIHLAARVMPMLGMNWYTKVPLLKSDQRVILGYVSYLKNLMVVGRGTWVLVQER